MEVSPAGNMQRVNVTEIPDVGTATADPHTTHLVPIFRSITTEGDYTTQ